jgi:hypothetical protein
MADYFQAMEAELTLFEDPSRARLINPGDWIRCMKGKNYYYAATADRGFIGAKKAERLLDASPKRGKGGNKRGGRRAPTNKYQKYRQGRCAPTVASAARASENAQVDLVSEVLHPIWDSRIIDPRVDVGNQLSNLMAKYMLGCEFRQICNAVDTWGPPSTRHFRHLLDEFIANELGNVEQPTTDCVEGLCWLATEEPTLGTLAGLTLVYKWLRAKAASAHTRSISRALYFQLLALGPELARRGICRLIYAYYLKFIFPQHPEAAIRSSSQELLQRSAALLRVAARRLDKETRLRQSDVGKMLMLALARCDFLKIAFHPPFVMQMGDERLPACFEQSLLEWLYSQDDHIDASLCALLQHGAFPPSDLSSRSLPVRTHSVGWLPLAVEAL